MKNYSNLTRRGRLLLLMLFALLAGGVSPAWAEAKALPYSYGFENNDLDSEGWTKYFGTSLTSNNAECAIVSAAKKTGSYGFRFSSYHTSGANEQYLISPELNAPNGVEVSFYYTVTSSNGFEKFKVGYSKTDTDVANFTWGDEISTNSTSWLLYENSFPVGTKYVAIYYYSNYQYRLYVDDFKICKTPTCITPTGLTTADLTSSSVSLSWTSNADAWNVQYKKAADSDWTDVSGNITSKTYTLTGLTPATAYQARVRTYCDASDQSEWTDAVSFTTDCVTITSFPYSESFNSLTSGIPMCWNNTEGTTTNDSYKWNFYATGHNGACVRFNSYNNSSNNTNMLKTPAMNFTSGKLMQLSFWYKNPTGGDFSVYISNDGGVTYTTSLATALTGQSDWKQQEIVIPAEFSENVVIVFKATSNYGNGDAYIYLDDVVVEEAPACPKPTGLTASNATYNSVELAWTAGSDETEWKIIYGAAGFNPESEGTTIGVTDNPYTLTGLTFETAYDVYVKAVKGNDESVLSDKASFTTTERYPTPTGLAISNLTTTSATLTWTAGAATSWEVAINTTGETPSNDAETGVEVNTAAYDFSELTAETTYYAFVREKDGENYSSWSAACEFTPSAYTYLTVNDGTTTNSYVPVYGYFSAASNLGGQFIIPATNLTDVQNKVIKKLTFYSNTSEYDYAEAEFDVCIKEISDATMPSSMYAWDSSWTTVYSGKLAVVGEKMNISFTTDYNYNGSNLLVGIHKTSTDKSGSNYNVQFYGNNSSSYMSNYAPNGNRQKFQPKTTIGYQEKTGSELKVFDGETELTESPASFDFGLAEAGTTHTFTLKNTAATSYVATISSTNLTVSPTEVTPTAEGVSFTVTMPEQDITDQAVVITPATASGLEPFTINVSGTLRDANKFYQELNTTSLPTGWTEVGSWTHSTTNGAYTTAWYLTSDARLKTPMLNVAAGEKFIIEAKGNASSGNESYQHLQLEYSADGTNWTVIGEEVSLTSSFKTFTLTTPNNFEAGNYYIALHGSQVAIRMFYGGETVSGANFAINTDGSTQNFGSVKFGETAQKSYTVTNSGNADLSISFASSGDFTVLNNFDASGKTLKLTDNFNWGSANVYAWDKDGNPLLGKWPGTVAETVINGYGETQFVLPIPDGAVGLIFNNGNGAQTEDITDFGYEGYWMDGTKDNLGHYKVTGYDPIPITLTVNAGGSKNFTVSMNTASSGDKSGNVVLTFDALNATSFTIPCKGNVKDANYLFVDFENEQFPEGWQVGADWSIETASGNKYAVQSNTKTASALVTTPLTVAENETLKFKACRNASAQANVTSLKVRYSTNGGVTWSEYTNFSVETSALTEQTLSGVPKGTVILEFFGSNIKLDDIEGFTKTTKPALAVTEGTAVVANGDTKDFGYLNANGTATYTVKNIGNATLNATISGEGVIVSPANISVAAGETADVTVTLAYGEPYGAKTGSITINSEDWVGAFVVNFTAELIDQTDFVEDFEGGKPDGWYSEWNYGQENGNGVAYIYTGNNKALITKKVYAENGKNELKFKAKTYSGETGTLAVYTTYDPEMIDRNKWNEPATTFNLTNEFQEFSLGELSNGNYYLKFESADAVIDDVKGLGNDELPARDLYAAIPTITKEELTPGESLTSSIKVTNVRNEIATNGVYAKWWYRLDAEGTGFTQWGDATAAQDIDGNGNATFSITRDAPAEEGTYIWLVQVLYGNNDMAYESEHYQFTVAHTTSMSVTDFAVVTPTATADDDNKFTAEFNVTVQNTGSTSIAANDVSVSITDGSGNAYNDNATTWTLASSQTIFLTPGEYSNDGAVLALCSWNTSSEQTWTKFTETSITGFYSAELEGNTNFTIVRLKKSTDDGYDSANGGLNWNNRYNNSIDYTLTDGNVYTFKDWSGDRQAFTTSTMATLAKGISTTLKVTLTTDAGEGGQFTFKAKENLSSTSYWSSKAVTVTAKPATVAATIGAAGYTTFASAYSLDLDNLSEGLTAYYVKADGVNSDAVKLTKATGKVEPGTGLVLKGNAGSYTIGTAEKTDAGIDGNLMVGCTTDTDVPQNAGYYVLANHEGEAQFQSLADHGLTIPAGKAYLDATSIVNGNARLTIVIDDDTTGIMSILREKGLDGDIYTIEGIRVENPKKGGLYIINGKKVVIK